ncbi:MAG: hypothetical protein HW403_1250 [Dehalococcoidia bacterium]|nr:hypothetical protein [Dehalococcoidia bacterium]
MLLEGGREGVTAVGASNEEEVVALLGADDCFDGVQSRIAYRPRREAGFDVGVIGGVHSEIGLSEPLLPVAESIHAFGDTYQPLVDSGELLRLLVSPPSPSPHARL